MGRRGVVKGADWHPREGVERCLGVNDPKEQLFFSG